MQKLSILAISAMLLAQTVPAFAQSAADINRIENRLLAMEKKIFSGNMGGDSSSAVNPAIADFEVRLQQLEAEGQRVYGSVEELAHAVQQLTKKLELIVGDLDMRMADIEKNQQDLAGKLTAAAKTAATAPVKAAAIAEAKPQAKAAPVTAATVEAADEEATATAMANAAPPMSAEELYKKSYDMLKAASYDQSVELFKMFLQHYPDHQLADNSHYWLGEIYLVQKMPEQAVLSFSSGLSKFPQGNKAAANLLKMGVALQRMERLDHAKSAWSKLIKDFPDSPEAEKAKHMLENLG